MSKQYTQEETKAWLDSLPRKGIGVKAILEATDGTVLVLQPVRKGWQLPGGTVEQNESPQASLVREIKEELDLNVDPDSLKLVGVAFRPDYDHIVIFYKSTSKLTRPVAFKLQVEEVAAYKFVPPQQLPSLLNQNYKQVLQGYLGSLD